MAFPWIVINLHVNLTLIYIMSTNAKNFTLATILQSLSWELYLTPELQDQIVNSPI